MLGDYGWSADSDRFPPDLHRAFRSCPRRDSWRPSRSVLPKHSNRASEATYRVALFWRPDLGLILIPQDHVLIIDAQHVTKAQALHFGSVRDNMTCRRNARTATQRADRSTTSLIQKMVRLSKKYSK